MTTKATAMVLIGDADLLLSWQAEPVAWRRYLAAFRAAFPDARFDGDARGWRASSVRCHERSRK